MRVLPHRKKARTPAEPEPEPATAGRGAGGGPGTAPPEPDDPRAAAGKGGDPKARDLKARGAKGGRKGPPPSFPPGTYPPPGVRPPRRTAAAARARRSAAVERARRARAARRLGAAKRPRSGLLVAVLTLGVLIAAVVVSGGLVAASLRNRPDKLVAPLRIYPVTQVTPGQCAAGTPGVTGQTPTGLACYQVSTGLAIHRVADIRVQRNKGAHEVAINLLPVDRRAFAALTRGTVGKDVAFVVKDRLVTAPKVDMPITGGKIIIMGSTSGYSRPDAERIVKELRGT